jgi:single-strand DNA-binding protein
MYYLHDKLHKKMESLNKVCLIGNVGNDPEIKISGQGNHYARFSLATTSSYKEKNSGQKKTMTEWHKVVCYSSSLTSIIHQYVKKGHRLYIEGALQTREYEDQNHQKRSITQIVLGDFNSRLIMLSVKEKENESYKAFEILPNTPSSQSKNFYSPFPASPLDKKVVLEDDEIPF